MKCSHVHKKDNYLQRQREREREREGGREGEREREREREREKEGGRERDSLVVVDLILSRNWYRLVPCSLMKEYLWKS